MVNSDSMGSSLQLVGAQFSNFLLRKLSREFKLRGMSILQLHEFQMVIFPSAGGYGHVHGRASGTLVVLQVLRMLI